MASDFTLTILGCSTAVPNPGGVCSGYLLRSGEASLLVDCGSGIVGRLRQHLSPERLWAAVISHWHADHYFDLIPLFFALRFGPQRPLALGERLPLFVPPGGRAHLRRLGRLVDGSESMLNAHFDVREYTTDSEHAIGGFGVTFVPVQHYVPSHAMRVRSTGGGLMAYSSDVGPCPGLLEAARGADLFMCESALLDPSGDPTPERRGHMSTGEAGAYAKQAGARQLVITHFKSDAGGPLDRQQRAAAEQEFGGPVILAREGETYPVAPE